jgi:membrane fusion protein, heavy metal efflux system
MPRKLVLFSVWVMLMMILQDVIAAERITQSVTLTPQQLKSIKTAAATASDFQAEQRAIGIVDFNQDKQVQVYSPWTGRISQIFYTVGKDVKKGDILFTVDSPDLVQAESNLLTTFSLLNLANQSLARTRELVANEANSQKDLEQAINNRDTAEANYKAAFDALKIFGLSHDSLLNLLKTHTITREFPVRSPFTGRIVQRNASIGTLTQPSMNQAPFVIADISKMWLLASVNEVEINNIHIGEKVAVNLVAYPGRSFDGVISYVDASVDANTHRVTVRSEINDPKHELKPQMLGNFTIKTDTGRKSIGVPLNAVVREGDGSFCVFVTKDNKTFEKRKVRLGMTQGNQQEILAGLNAGETYAQEGALFISNTFALKYQ